MQVGSTLYKLEKWVKVELHTNIEVVVTTGDQNEKKLPEESFNLERLALMGEMLPEVAHEIRNLMQVVTGFIQVELSQNTFSPTTQRRLQRSYEHAMFASELTGSLLRFVRPHSEEFGDPGEAVKVVVDLFRSLHRQGTAIQLEMQGPRSSVVLPTGYLQLIFANIVKNALDALENADKPQISIRVNTDIDPVQICISNSGPHISESVLAHLFSKYSTSKPSARGTGLGLHIAAKLVAEAGGQILAENVATGGVKFEISLRKASQPSINRAPQSLETRMEGARIMLVDDDQLVREVLQLMIVESGGHVVRTCGSGQEALQAVASTDFDALLLDLRMKGLSGREVFAQLDAGYQKKVIFITGDNLDKSAQNFLKGTGQPVLLKPLKIAAIVQAVQRVHGI